MIFKWFTQHPGATETDWISGHSSFIDSIKYNKEQSILFIKMDHGTYEYKVAIEIAEALSEAISWGQYYNDHIKQKYDHIAYHPKFISAATSFIKKSAPSSIGEVFGILQLAALVMPIQVSLPLRIAIGGVFITGDLILKAKGIDKPPVLDIAINIASGYSILALLRYPVTTTTAILRTPVGNLKYMAADGTMSYSVTKPQALSTFLLGGKIGRSAVRGLENMLYVTPPQTKALQKIVQKGFIPNPAFAQKTVQATEPVFTPSQISRIGTNVPESRGINDYLRLEYKKEQTFKWMEAGASVAIAMLPVGTYLSQDKVQVHKPAKKKKKPYVSDLEIYKKRSKAMTSH